MDKIEVLETIKINGKSYKVKGIDTFFAIIKKSYVEGTTEQLKLLAYSLKDYMIDRLLSQSPGIGKGKVFRPESLKKVLTEPEEEKKEDKNMSLPTKKIILPRETNIKFKTGNTPFRLKPLNKKYLERKIRSDLDNRTLIATGEYIQNILVRRKVTSNKKDIFYCITVSKRKTKHGNITFSTLAKIHEYGTEKYTVTVDTKEGKKNITMQIPARPHWAPTYEVAKQTLANFGRNVSAKILKENLEKL